jgi:2-polyprenyl-3-methyl-5-hydroxy-6-metoxy-1,4-benzoquinol methylase
VYAHAGGKPPGGFVDVGCGNGLLYCLVASVDSCHELSIHLNVIRGDGVSESRSVLFQGGRPCKTHISVSKTSTSEFSHPQRLAEEQSERARTCLVASVDSCHELSIHLNVIRGDGVSESRSVLFYWARVYAHAGGKPPGGFVDVGCGNGLLYVPCL